MKNLHTADAVNSDKRLYSQLRNLRKIFDQAFFAVICEKRALDRFLSSYWRENRCFGSRDRRLFSESIFAFFRFYGFLRLLVNDEELTLLDSGNSRALSGKSAAMMLAGAWVLENLPPEPSHRLLTSEFGLPPMPPVEKNPDPQQLWRKQRFEKFAENCGIKLTQKLDWQLLQSPWSLEFLQDMPDKDEYFASLAKRPPLWLRVQNSDPGKVIDELTQAGLTVKPHPRLKSALAVVGGSVNLYTLDVYRSGRVEVQDLASQVISHACMPQKGERWWDCCAGAGGKTLALAELMQRTGKVVAGDIRSYKLEDLKKRARRSGFPNIETRPWDGNKVPPRKGGSFDGILIDAPCSCSGVWRRNPDGRWSSSAAEVEKVNIIQRNVLENVLPALRKNGILVYATCSVFASENRNMVNDFLLRHPEFELESFENVLTGEMCDGILEISGCQGDSDSMFAARLRLKK